MSENPYAAPQDAGPQETRPVAGIPSGSREDLRSVAMCQKGIMVCILFYLAGVLSQLALPSQLRKFVEVGVICVALIGAALVFFLAIKVHGVVLGVILGLLSLVPLLGLIVLLSVNGKATGIMKANGVRVGLLGADLSSI